MLDPEQVFSIWEEKRLLVKPYYIARDNAFRWKRKLDDKRKPTEDYDMPEFWPGYNASCEERERIRPHVEHGFYPEKLFRKRAPNETEAEADYGKANFKQTTLVHYQDFENTVLRALHENNWTIDYGSDEPTLFEEYVTEGIEEFGSVLGYVKSIVTKVKALDAMGLITVLPKEIATVSEVVVDEEGNEVEIEVIDPDDPLQPVPAYIPVNDVWGFDYDSWYLFKTNETSWVESHNREKTGLVFMLIDDQNAWKIAQTGKKGEFTFEITLWFAHQVGYPPAIHLRGNTIQHDGFTRWQSPYLPAVELFDIVLLDEDYLRKSKAKCVFPHKVMLGDDCTFVDEVTGKQCFYGKIVWIDETGEHEKTCPSCSGTGQKSRIGPLGELIVRPGDRTTGSTEIANVSEALSFVGPPTETLSLLRKEIEANTATGRGMLHLSTETQAVQDGSGTDVKTATQSGIDLRAMGAFVKPIADQIFKVYGFILESIGKMREGPSFKKPIITLPTSFDVRTDNDLLIELEEAVDMPPVVRSKLLDNYLGARFSHDPAAMLIYDVVKAADKLFSMPAAAIQPQQQLGILKPWQITLHWQAENFYDELSRQGKLTGDIDKDAAQLIVMAEANTPKVESPAADRLAATIQR